MLGQPVSMLLPQVVGFKLKEQLREGSTATDLVLTVTEILRKTGVVGKKQKALQPKSEKCIFVGYSEDVKVIEFFSHILMI